MDAEQQFTALEAVFSDLVYAERQLYSFGHLNVAIAYETPCLSQYLGRALAGFCFDPTTPADYEIFIAESSRQKKMPALDWPRLCGAGAEGYEVEGIYWLYQSHVEILNVIHLAKRKAFYIVKDASSLPWWIAASPLQIILNVITSQHGMQLTHTAAVSKGEQAVLLTGKGGSGKSTTALDCLCAGYEFLGEDYCLVSLVPPYEVYSVYCSAKWTPQTQAWFKDYASFIVNPKSASHEKGLLYYDSLFPNQLVRKKRIAAIFSLSIGQREESHFLPQSLSAAFFNLSFCTFSQLPFTSASNTEKFLNLLKATPYASWRLAKERKLNVAYLDRFFETLKVDA